MKYVISINQLTWQHYFPKANERHIIIFEVIKSICNSVSKNMIRTDDGHTWIASQMIIDEVPILQIKTKGGLTRYIKDLVDWNLIDRISDPSLKRFYYKITEVGEKLDRSLSEQDVNKLKSTVEKSKRPFTNVNDTVYKNKRPVYKCKQINNTSDHNKGDTKIPMDSNNKDITENTTRDINTSDQKKVEDFSGEKLSICPICKFDKQKLYELVPVNEHLHCPYCEKDFDIKTLQEMKPKSQATDFLKWYKRRYEEEFKEPIDIVWSKDTQLVKGLLKTFKYDILQQKAELFLKIKDDDFINGTGHTIGKFKIKINALRKDTGKVVIRGPSEGFYAYK